MKGLLALAAFAGLLLAGCSGSTGGSDGTAPPMEDGKYVIQMVSGNKFDPAAATIPAGSTVAWIVDNGVHDVTAQDDSWSSEDDGAKLTPGDRYERTFDEPGVVEYKCALHEGSGMKGTLTVT